MRLREIKYADINAFSKLLVDYSQNEKHFSKLISCFPSGPSILIVLPDSKTFTFSGIGMFIFPILDIKIPYK